jgi:hypothetical protein
MDQAQNSDLAMFKWVQHKPVGELKSLTDERLQQIRETLVKEVREVGRAQQWIDGIIKLKALEREKQAESDAGDNA